MERVKNKTVKECAASLGTVGCIYGEQATLLTVASTLSYITRLVRTLEKHVVRRQGELDRQLQKVHEDCGLSQSM